MMKISATVFLILTLLAFIMMITSIVRNEPPWLMFFSWLMMNLNGGFLAILTAIYETSYKDE